MMLLSVMNLYNYVITAHTSRVDKLEIVNDKAKLCV